ncbi:MFS transporter [Roseomonas rosulenta]|uniref:MFS transporter n=1 Tax=Roseomonas rosulenta TaxID=2748667 RepID=UPI0018DFA244|nr:MFS transporter [Roseomonas rosulenta]
MIHAPSVWTVMLALLGTHLAGMGVFLAVPVLAPAIAAEVGIPAALAGVHTALVYGGALVSGPLAGAFIRRYGGIRVLQAGLVICGAAVAVAALGHPVALALSALVGGLGHGPVTPAGSHLLAQKAPPNRRALIFSLKQCGVPAGAMLIAAATPAIAAAWGWRAGVLAVAAFLAVAALVLQPLRRALDAERDRNAAIGSLGAAWAAALGSLAILRDVPVLRRMTVMSALYGISQFCFSSFFVVFQVEALGVPLTEAGLRLAMAQAAGVAGRVVWGLAADRVGSGPVLTGLGLGAAASGAALLLAGPDWPGLILTLAGMGMGATAIGWNGVFLAETARLAPAGQVGAATAAAGFVFGACMLVGPPAFSAMVQASGGYALGFGLCMATALLGAALIRGAGGVAKP